MFAKLRSKMTATKCDKHSPQDDYRTPIGEMPDNDTADNYAYIDDEILVLDWTASKTESTFYVIELTIELAFLTWLLLPFLDSDKLIIPSTNLSMSLQFFFDYHHCIGILCRLDNHAILHCLPYIQS